VLFTANGVLSRKRDVIEYDVAISGAGPVGLFLACELGLAGIRTVVLERFEDPNIPTRAVGLGGRALNIPSMEAFYRRGFLEDLRNSNAMWFGPFEKNIDSSNIAAGPKFRIAGHFAGIMLNAELVDYDDPDFQDRGPAAAACLIDLVTIEKLLARRALDLGVKIRRGVTVNSFAQSDNGVVVETSEGTVEARWLAGCDGGKSTVRKLGGFAFPGTAPEITAYSALVEVADPKALRAGWNRTPIGLYVFGPGPNRVLVVEFKGTPPDRDTPITKEELQTALRNVSGIDVTITKLLAATRFTDNARQAETYRMGRVLLAGDSAHVHSPFGGQGLNVGLGDAMNLGWKLASVVKGWTDEALLDTYTAERHPNGTWVLEWTRAQVALMRPEANARAMGEITRELIDTRAGATFFAKRIAGVWQRYDLGSEHALVGRSAPDLVFSDGSRLGAYLQTGRGTVFYFEQRSDTTVEEKERYRIVRAQCADASPALMLLVRPDGFVAWAGEADGAELREALCKWLGVTPEVSLEADACVLCEASSEGCR
jgi:2-polyprenyl-6-methoxyphenol hydroxylase-like FAD-dependent oxidoreductase